MLQTNVIISCFGFTFTLEHIQGKKCAEMKHTAHQITTAEQKGSIFTHQYLNGKKHLSLPHQMQAHCCVCVGGGHAFPKSPRGFTFF
jgi:hypothetical protein